MKSIFRVFTWLLAASFLVASASFAEQKVYKWQFQSHWPASSASFKPLKDFFEKDVYNLSKGRLQVSVYPAAAIVPTKDIFGACRMGTVDGATAFPSYWMGQIPITAVAGNLPMNLNTEEEGVHFWFKLGFEKMLKEAHAKHNLMYYSERVYPTAMVSKKPVVKLEDLKGLKIRTSGALADMFKELGAAPTMIPGEEIYLALQTGVIDAAHWGAASGALSIKLCEVAKYYFQPNLSMTTDIIVLNKKSFEALPSDLQQALDRALVERALKRTQEYKLEEKRSLETMMKDYKVKISRLSPEDEKKMRAAAIKVWDKLAAKDPESAKAIAILKQYLHQLGRL
ncbi:MAG TPA: TRAP transporter substrate-binding protein DctP [Syntrophales bacterium]|nr:TRAP transporter substrate-binding protein DctP [Syntrophales bacterium]HOL59280.1 TRAP transporter substrate-binding protein DctP [Syntrophales bacterium]HPO35330.1 TRAP transporter substrate-binding protein DctP [Syntrophales bacterium]